MNILLLCGDIDGKTGWSTYSRDLLHALRERGHDVRACVHDRSLFSLLPGPNTLLAHPWLARFYAWRLGRILRLVQPDVIHITVESYAFIVPHLSAKWQKKTILTIHGTYGVYPLRDAKLRQKAKDYYDCIARFITVSKYTKMRVEEEMAMRISPAASDQFSKRATVITNGITLPAWNGKRPANATKQILLVGGVKQRKGVLQALRACAAYRDAYGTPFHFTIVGTMLHDGYVAKVKAGIRSLGLEQQVTLAGPVNDAALQELYGKTDVFLMPSETSPDSFEGFGLVFLEANARGIPVIGPDESGTAEAIAEGVSGYQVSIDNADMIADRLHRILDENSIDPAACRTWAEEHSVKMMASEVERIYTSLPV